VGSIRLDLNHSINVIKTANAVPFNSADAFASSVNSKLLLNQIVDNVNRASEGDLNLSIVGATAPTNTTTISASPTTTTVQASTSLTSAIDSIQTSIPVTSTANFSTSGTIQINSEQMVYSSTTATTFDGVSRGANSTSTAVHANGSVVSPTVTVKSTDTLINAVDVSTFSAAGTIQIDNEQMNYSSRSTATTPNTFTISARGVNGTTAVDHSSSISIKEVNTVTATATTINVTSAAGFPTSGTIQIGAEHIAYTSINTASTPNTIGGLTRGFNGTVASVHTAADVVLEIDINATSTSLATVSNPISYILITSNIQFYFQYTTKDAVVSPILSSATFAYHNSTNPITNITFWNGTLQPDATPITSFTIKQSSLQQRVTYVSAS